MAKNKVRKKKNKVVNINKNKLRDIALTIYTEEMFAELEGVTDTEIYTEHNHPLTRAVTNFAKAEEVVGFKIKGIKYVVLDENFIDWCKETDSDPMDAEIRSFYAGNMPDDTAAALWKINGMGEEMECGAIPLICLPNVDGTMSSEITLKDDFINSIKKDISLSLGTDMEDIVVYEKVVDSQYLYEEVADLFCHCLDEMFKDEEDFVPSANLKPFKLKNDVKNGVLARYIVVGFIAKHKHYYSREEILEARDSDMKDWIFDLEFSDETNRLIAKIDKNSNIVAVNTLMQIDNAIDSMHYVMDNFVLSNN